MKINLSKRVFGWCFLTTFASGLANAQNPDQPPQVVPLPLKPGVSMGLCKVYLGWEGKGDPLLASRRITMGDRDLEQFSEPLVAAELGGSFRAARPDGKDDWYYMLGESEVTCDQWNAVVNSVPAPTDKPGFPKTSVTPAEILVFFEKLNQLIRTAADSPLPKIGNRLGYFRLPTEMEWEFAARGGLPAIRQNKFEKAFPYPEDRLAEFEIFAADAPVRWDVTTANPVGLRNMLGNVAELVAGTYSLDYFHGRLGCWIQRGGSYLDPKNQMRASIRFEVPPCRENGDPIRNPTVGFRVCYGSFIFDKNNTDQLEAACRGRGENPPQPPPSPVVGTAETNITGPVNAGIKNVEQMQKDAAAGIAAIEAQNIKLKNAELQAITTNLKDQLNRQTNLANAALKEAAANVRAATKERAMSYIRIGAFAEVQKSRLQSRIDGKQKIINIVNGMPNPGPALLKDRADAADQILVLNEQMEEELKPALSECRDGLRPIELDLLKESFEEREQAWRDAKNPLFLKSLAEFKDQVLKNRSF